MKREIQEHFKKADPHLFEAFEKFGLLDLDFIESTDYFTSLTREIIGQQLAGKAAVAIFGRFKTLFPDSVPDPALVLKLSEEKLRGVGLSRTKVAALKDLALKIDTKEVELEKLTHMSDTEVISHLTKVRGIGPWTAEMFLIFTLSREDVYSLGDLGLKNALKKLHGLVLNKDETLDFTQKWSPYRSYAARILWRYLDNKTPSA